ncbi:MAG: DUF3969 family protein [Eubacterium sp.]|nr:DUF3969 family protein [Eubacterium sp.]
MIKIEEKKLLIKIIGTLDALYNGAITICEGERYLFSPCNIMRLTQDGYDRKIIKILEVGCELEDIESLIPHKLSSNIIALKQEAINVLKEYDSYEDIMWD